MALPLTTADTVRARIAAMWLSGGGEQTQIGRYLLRAAQRQVTSAVLRALARYGGALVADPPGTGKTLIALAVAAQLKEVPIVVAPSALRAQWLQEASFAGAEILFISFESLGRSASTARSRLVIVDEAHHARTTATRRYAHLAALCESAKVLLLSATPVVNRRSDRDALLSLFLGARASSLEPREIGEIVIRRGEDAARPSVRRIPDLQGASDVAGIAEALDRLPPPLPAADGRAATHLVRISLAMAWRSSLAALDAALRRREQRGLALRDALADGRWPDRAALRLWLVGDDATQLALSLEIGEPGQRPDADAVSAVDSHLMAVRDLRALVRNAVPADTTARADALVELCAAHPQRRVVCFAQHAATVRALWSMLKTRPRVVAITGERVSAAAGHWTRDEVLQALGPRAGELRLHDPRAIQLLLTTDLLAEGVELQGVAIVVHGDGAWTPARLEQRVGRAVRVGSAANEILVTGFRAPAGARPLLALAARLARKRAARARSLEEATSESKIARLLGRWRAATAADAITACVEGTRRCFVSVVEHGAPTRRSLVCGRWIRGRWKVSDDPAVAVLAISHAGGCRATDGASLESTAQRALMRWDRAQRARNAIGGNATHAAALSRRVRVRIDRALAGVPLAERAAAAAEWSGALASLASSPGEGLRRRIGALDRTTSTDRDFAESLVRLAAEGNDTRTAVHSGATDRSVGPLRLLALLLVERAPGLSHEHRPAED